ncbi:hypothetical protein ACS0TY_008605 [Phlomoides rotata]
MIPLRLANPPITRACSKKRVPKRTHTLMMIPVTYLHASTPIISSPSARRTTLSCLLFKARLTPLTTPGAIDRTTKNGPKKIIFIVLVPLCVITSLVTASIAICFFVKRQQPSPTSKKCKEDIENFLLQYGSLAPKRYKYSEIKKITKSFSDELGKGGYGSVYKGGLHDGSLVAVKVLMETDSNGEEFMNEVASISRTSHVNVVTLLGFCYEGEKRALVYEFMPNKSLDKFLRKSREAGDTDCVLDLQKLYKIAVGIARGLEYLHMGCSTRIVHFDIKPHNIILDDDLCPKISDFGLAKLCKKKQSELSVFGTRGTIGYIAPEMFSRNFGGVSHKSDVYSYGMMVLEMAGARERFEAHVNQSSENYFPDKLYEEVTIDMTNKLDDFKIGDDEEETRKKIFLIGFWCIQTNLSDRPSMSKVVEMLEGSLESIQIPPKPFQFSPNISDQEFSTSRTTGNLEINNME